MLQYSGSFARPFRCVLWFLGGLGVYKWFLLRSLPPFGSNNDYFVFCSCRPYRPEGGVALLVTHMAYILCSNVLPLTLCVCFLHFSYVWEREPRVFMCVFADCEKIELKVGGGEQVVDII